MPKPRSGEVYKKEVRLTPYDGLEITREEFASVSSFFTKMVFFEEGDAVKKLHYHGYVESEFGDMKVREVLRSLCHCNDKGVNGNALYFTRKPHDHSWGYIAKHGRCIFRYGESQTTIDEWIRNSEEYRKSKESERKKEQRKREEELGRIVALVKKDLEVNRALRYVEGVIDLVLKYCVQEQVAFPARTQMEMFVLKILYQYNEGMVRSYYSRAFQCI